MHIVDNRGLSCPQPVINTKKALDVLESGSLVSIVDNSVARENVLKFARSQGCIAEATEENGVYRVVITKGNVAAAKPSNVSPAPQHRTTLYLIGSDEFGRGSTELGNALAKTFFYALAESGTAGNYLVFVNSGVRLVCAESPVLESIKKLMDAGWDVKACGTCLDFYGLKEKLQLGEITNMYTIVELMEQSVKVVTI